ncbi:MAG: lytic transglycosylase [Rhodobacteraceae bacterium]|nr:lytic transglycosylase [Paracoccaceae bacterium]
MRLSSLTRLLIAAAGVAVLSGCLSAPTDAGTEPQVSARWDHRPEGALWTAAKYDALGKEGRSLIEAVPDDIDKFCPGYEQADMDGRKAFWTALFSGLAGYESTWRAEAAGAGGRYRGLLQIWPTSARFYGCDLSHPKGLYDGPTNLRCAARIAAQAVERDQVVAGGPGNWGGVAKDWPPLRRAATRADIASYTRALPVCQG